MLSVRRTTNLDMLERLNQKIFEDKDIVIDPAALWWVMTFNDKIAGFAGLKLELEDGCRYGYLCLSGILPAFRGKGLQKELIRARDKEAQRMGLVMNISYTAWDNPKSANNLIKCGYLLYCPQERYGLKGAYYFRKEFLKGE